MAPLILLNSYSDVIQLSYPNLGYLGIRNRRHLIPNNRADSPQRQSSRASRQARETAPREKDTRMPMGNTSAEGASDWTSE